MKLRHRVTAMSEVGSSPREARCMVQNSLMDNSGRKRDCEEHLGRDNMLFAKE